jgi:hypothetical protein
MNNPTLPRAALAAAALLTSTHARAQCDPIITQQPADTTACTATDVTLAVAADGRGQAMTYQWQLVDPSGNPSNLTDGPLVINGVTVAIIEGSSTPQLTARQQYFFNEHCRCVVTNSCGGTPSNAAILTSEVSLTHWEKIDNSTSPPARLNHAMCLDSSRGQVVLFGGRTAQGAGGQVLTDTWEFDGLVWSPRSNFSDFPQAGQRPAMGFDASTHQTVLFGGRFADGSYSDQTWTYDGQAWTRENPLFSPSPRDGTNPVYSPNDQRLYLFGGRGPTADLADTWAHEGGHWVLVSDVGPPARSSHAMAALGNKIVMFGGRSGNQVLSDTWEFDLTTRTWLVHPPNHSPSARAEHSMTYDPGLDAIVLVGGVTVNNGVTEPLSDTWVWDGHDWTQQTAPGLTARGPRQTISLDGTYDPHPSRNRLMLFGGFGANGAALGDTVVLVRDVSRPLSAQTCGASPCSFAITAGQGGGGSGGSFAYQWSTRNTNLTDIYTTVVEGPNTDSQGIALFTATGTTSPSLVITPASLPPGTSYQFRCTASSSCGQATSDAATFTDVSAPAVSIQPLATHVCNSGDLTLTADATNGGYVDSPSLQWECEDPRLPGHWFDIQDGPNRFVDAGGIVIVLDGAGSRTPHLTTHLVKLYTDANFIRLRAIASNSCGPTPSSPSTITVCMADLNCDTGVNVADYLAFLQVYASADPRADMTGDGAINVADYLRFLQRFAAGCP